MNLVRKIAQNTVVILIGRILSKIISLIVYFFLARYLEPVGIGIYSFVFAYLSFFNIIIDWGMPKILVREISRDKAIANKLLGNAIILRFSLSTLAIFSACLIISLLHYPLSTKTLVYIASLGFLFSFTSLYNVIFITNLQNQYLVAVDIFNGILKALVFLLLIFLKAPLLHFIIASVILGIPGWLIILNLSRRFIKPVFKMDLSLWKKLIGACWPLALTSVFGVILMRIDQIMIFQILGNKGAESLGYYSVAVRLVEALGIIPIAFMTSVFPLMSKYFKSSPDSLEKTYKLSYKYMMLLIVPVAVAVSFLSRFIILLAYTEKFLPAVPALSILAWAEVWVFLGTVNSNILISTDNQKIYFFLSSSGATINVILNAILIPRYGIVGAGVATLLSYGVGPILGLFLPRIKRYFMVGFKSMVRPLVAGGGMAIGMLFLKFMGFYSLIFSFPIYVGLLFLIKGIDSEDIRLVKQIFKPEKSIYVG